MTDPRPIVPGTTSTPRAVTGEVIEAGTTWRERSAGADAPRSARGAEPVLRAIHGMLMGLATLAIVLPAVILVVAVIVPAMILWLAVAAVLRVVFRVLAALTGARPDAVMPGAVLRARAVRGFSGFTRGWGTTPNP